MIILMSCEVLNIEKIAQFVILVIACINYGSWVSVLTFVWSK